MKVVVDNRLQSYCDFMKGLNVSNLLGISKINCSLHQARYGRSEGVIFHAWDSERLETGSVECDTVKIERLTLRAPQLTLECQQSWVITTQSFYSFRKVLCFIHCKRHNGIFPFMPGRPVFQREL